MGLENLRIESSPKTPEIELNKLSGDLNFYGRSIPENAAKVYEPVFDWITEYSLHPRPTTNIRFNLEYYNTSSSIWLAKILKVLVNIPDPDCVLIIHLYVPLEDYEEIEDFGDLKDAFSPLINILAGAIISIGIKLYGTDDNGLVVRETSVFI
jgi:hypothetical protein